MTVPATIDKLLVANRGEIARRIFATCRQMGIRTVAVYSDSDRESPFVREADEAIALGGDTPAESYLSIEGLLAAARRTGADAIHPGYGFLAENAAFARSVQEAGLTWIGPPADAIEAMGDKLAAKGLMDKAGVPTLPSIDLTGMEDGSAAKAAAEVGFPVLVKAAAGGGGKGMRIVGAPEDLGEAVASARRESAGAFGDDRVFLERYLQVPRHIEIQVFGDIDGMVVPMFERECSIQRRHQKIIEEAPSPAIDPEQRARMGEAAVAAAAAVGYLGAGTVEFLYQDGDFYFLEMNTRLQVEHPVTELVTGLDLVRLQLLVAMGHPLPEAARHPEMQGHAIEARLYAEDATAGFLPVTGTLHRFEFPDMPGLRLDGGVESGSRISAFYDPLLAKVIAWAPTRPEAAQLLAGTLERAHIHGSVTNRNLLVRILRHPEFLEGSTDTHFLERHSPVELGAPLAGEDGERRAAVAAALAAQEERRRTSGVLSTIPSGWRNVPSQMQEVEYHGELHDVVRVGYRFRPSGLLEVEGWQQARLVSVDSDCVGLELDSHLGWYRVARYGSEVFVDGPDGPVKLVESPRFPVPESDPEAGSLEAPMPGTVTRVEVAEGDAVTEGQVLAVMEAMKMEHSLRAPHGGKVTVVRVSPGDQVTAGQTLIVVGER